MVVETGELEPGGDAGDGEVGGNGGDKSGGGWRRLIRLSQREYCSNLICLDTEPSAPLSYALGSEPHHRTMVIIGSLGG